MEDFAVALVVGEADFKVGPTLVNLVLMLKAVDVLWSDRFGLE